jgi:hypothetical protein
MKTRRYDREPRSYVIRVYRRSTRLLSGCVQDVRSGKTSPFQSMRELWSAIGGSKADAPEQEP